MSAARFACLGLGPFKLGGTSCRSVKNQRIPLKSWFFQILKIGFPQAVRWENIPRKMPENIYQFQCRTKDENRREVVFTGTSTHHDPSWPIVTHHDPSWFVPASVWELRSEQVQQKELSIFTYNHSARVVFDVLLETSNFWWFYQRKLPV